MSALTTGAAGSAFGAAGFTAAVSGLGAAGAAGLATSFAAAGFSSFFGAAAAGFGAGCAFGFSTGAGFAAAVLPQVPALMPRVSLRVSPQVSVLQPLSLPRA